MYENEKKKKNEIIRTGDPTHTSCSHPNRRPEKREKKKCRGYPSQLSSNEINNKEKKSTRGE